jgi:hypothetical protein
VRFGRHTDQRAHDAGLRLSNSGFLIAMGDDISAISNRIRSVVFEGEEDRTLYLHLGYFIMQFSIVELLITELLTKQRGTWITKNSTS